MDQPASPAASPSPAAAPGIARFKPVIPVAILILLPSLLVGWALRSGGMLYGMDMMAGSCYIRAFVGQELSKGRVAQWDPNSMCGFPLMAALQSGVFYPLTWPVLILDPGAFWSFTVLIHLILAGLFAYGWLHKGLSLSREGALLGALISMLSGYLLTHVYAGHIAQISAYPWLAALLWRTERLLARPTIRRWALLALTLALLILPGFPQFAFFGGLLVGIRLAVFVFAKREDRTPRLKVAAAAAGAGLLGAMLAAPQLLPTLELIPFTQRTSINTVEFATTYSLPPENLATLLTPSFFGDGTGALPYWGRSLIWEVCGFVGLGTIGLALIALGGRHSQRFLWAGIATAALLLALGATTPLFSVFYHLVPGVSLFRAPGRYLALFTLAMAALAAMGFDRSWKEEDGHRRAALWTGIGTAALLVALLLCILLGSRAERGLSQFWQELLAAVDSGAESFSLPDLRRRPDFPDASYGEARRSLLQAVLSLSLVGAGFLAQARGLLRGKAAAAAVGAVIFIDLLSFGHRFVTGVPDRNLPWPPEFVEFVKNQPGGPCRISAPGMGNARYVGKCQMAGIAHVGGYESMLLGSYAELMNAVGGDPVDRAIVMTNFKGPHPILDMLGARYWLFPRELPFPPEWKNVAGVEDCKVLEAPGAFPRAFLVPKAVSLPLRDVRLHYLTSPTTDFRKFVVLEDALPAEARAVEGDLGAATIVSSGSGRYEISAETASGAYLVLTESDYPGWEARIDDAPVKILRANHFVQAIWVPPGKHLVRFEYHSRRLAAGFLLCGLAALTLAGLAIRGRLKSAPPSGKSASATS